MNYEVESKKVANHVIQFLALHDNPNLYYHNLAHTKNVVAAAKEIGSHYELNEFDQFVLTTAAWFHDIGYPLDMDDHEQRSAMLAVEYLQNQSFDNAMISGIKKCILATKVPQQPHGLLEQIICDADLYYLGTDSYKQLGKLLKKEMKALREQEWGSAEAWRNRKISFFEAHQFHTDYCRLKLNKKKEENLAALKDKQAAALLETAIEASTGLDVIESGSVKSAINKDKKPTRGIETMFRISAANNVRVSVMADNKAHIMISVNSIVISVVFAFLIRSMDEYRHLLIPTIMLVVVNVLTIAFAVLATRPKATIGTFTQQQVEEKSVNLLFFGSFYKMNYPEYKNALNKMMNDSEFLYGSLTKDIFWQGKVLGRKYRLLRIAYNIFLYGIITSVLAFVIATIYKG